MFLYYWVASVSIRKLYKTTGKAYEISTLSENHTIGEMVLIEDKPRSATVVALTETKLIEIPLAPIRQDPEILAIVTQNISLTLSKRLRNINEITVKSMQNELDELKKRNALGMLTVVTLFFLTIYVLALDVLRQTMKYLPSTTIVTVPMIVVITLLLFYIIKRSQFPYATFGLTLKGWKKSLNEALFFQQSS
ncbi:cyclic nucleotide-binding domain-containing protein [Coxiella burnetii]|uniref:cyclic nucleotide-binding domain-containing protein n=1 Tax=Coxiella burnetii TaxID=777 RepID=UPI001269BA0E|nr:cyclic nucleotide-binding domain-containing protein [Coxiella burnetii]